jgi:hypothetical protein
MVYRLELVVGDVWTVWYTGWNWLELVVGDVWTVWYTGWNWL